MNNKMFERNRQVYIALFLVMIVLGLLSRKFAGILPNWSTLYLGDSLWAAMVYFMFALAFSNTKARVLALVALVFSFGIEFSQLYQAEWINTLRSNRFAALVLGRGFLWSDLFAYSIGILCSFALDLWIRKRFISNTKM